MVVFDKGYNNYRWHKSLTDQGIYWVTRIRGNAKYKVIERRYVKENGAVTSDHIIQYSDKQRNTGNLLPIRRLNLEVGQQAEVRSAWLRFPSFKLEPLSQVYTRLDEFTYRYSSNEGEFVADLTVDEVGFVTDYPGLWEAEKLGPGKHFV